MDPAISPELFFTVVPKLLPTFMLGFVALLGLLVQNKSFSEVVTGTVKTMVGVIILFTAVDLLVAVISPIAAMFSQIYAVEGQASVDFTIFLGEFSASIVLVMVFGFFINVLLARLTPLKYVFLTGHILFWNAYVITAALTDGGVITGVPLIVLGSIILGIISTVLPALIAPFIRQLTGTNNFTIGHSTTILAIIGAYIGKYLGDTSRSTEDIQIPETWSFVKELVISTSVIMALLYLVMGALAGPSLVAEQFAGGSVVIWAVWTLFQGLAFGAGIIILLQGVRMMLAEIVPAFHGIAQKIVPEAVPALDCPLVFPYAPNALVIGFPIAMITSLITLVIFGAAGFPMVLLPLVVAAFFDVGPAAVLGNATGGLRGAVLASAVGGVLLIVLQAISVLIVPNTAAGFLNAFGGNDFSLIVIVVGGIARLLGF